VGWLGGVGTLCCLKPNKKSFIYVYLTILTRLQQTKPTPSNIVYVYSCTCLLFVITDHCAL
jgi:hypothetical protein